MQYGSAIWQLARPRTLVLIWLHAVLFCAVLGAVPGVWQIVAALLVLAAWYVNAVAVNDISDEAVDRLNLPAIHEDKDRPLINRTITKTQLEHIAVGAAVIVVVGSWLLSPWLVLVATIMLGLNITYSLAPLRISARGGLAQLLLPIGYVLFPAAVTVAASGQLDEWLFGVAAGTYLVFVGRLFLKDIRDEKGDAATGKRTFLVRHGLWPTLLLTGIWMVIGMGGMLYALRPAPQVIFAGLWLLCSLTVAAGSAACYRQKRLDMKLLYVAVVGRAASCWLFCCVLATYLQQYYQLDITANVLLLLAAIGMFGFGVAGLFEEMQRVKQPARPHASTLEN